MPPYCSLSLEATPSRSWQRCLLEPHNLAALIAVLSVMQVRILCPDVEDNDNLNGQLLEMEVASLLDTVSAIKARLAEVLQLPARATTEGNRAEFLEATI